MPCPVRRRGSANWYFRGTIPKALRPKIAAMPKHMRPTGWSASGDIWISLKTPDREEAKVRCAEVTAEVANAIRSLSAPERSLNKEERVALAGEAYRGFVGMTKGEPGKSAKWKIVAALWKRGDVEAVNQYCSVTADAILRKKGLAVDDRSRELLIKEVNFTYELAVKRTKAYSESDYSPDTNLTRFPAWQEPQHQTRPDAAAPTGSSGIVTLSDLLEAWSQKKKRPRVTTVDAFRTSVHFFKAHLGHETISRITSDDVVAWKDAMVAEGKLTAKTINEKRLAAIRALYGWGLDRSNRKITGENVARGIRVEKDDTRERSKAFTTAEARAVLTAALNSGKAGGETRIARLCLRYPHLAAAKRWAPWICCYTGARIVEITQLRRQDVRNVEGIWVFDLRPGDGNTIKTDKARLVPVHSDLIAQGLLDFVDASKPGPLFYDPARLDRDAADGMKRSPAASVGSRLAEWVRGPEVGVTDRRIRPNHAWRHWFISQCRVHGVDREARYFMVGQVEGDGPSDIGNAYGDAPVPFLKRELEKIPAFPVRTSDNAGALPDTSTGPLQVELAREPHER